MYLRNFQFHYTSEDYCIYEHLFDTLSRHLLLAEPDKYTKENVMLNDVIIFCKK